MHWKYVWLEIFSCRILSARNIRIVNTLNVMQRQNIVIISNRRRLTSQGMLSEVKVLYIHRAMPFIACGSATLFWEFQMGLSCCVNSLDWDFGVREHK